VRQFWITLNFGQFWNFWTSLTISKPKSRQFWTILNFGIQDDSANFEIVCGYENQNLLDNQFWGQSWTIFHPKCQIEKAMNSKRNTTFKQNSELQPKARSIYSRGSWELRSCPSHQPSRRPSQCRTRSRTSFLFKRGCHRFSSELAWSRLFIG
jgi:hypothetical protein